MFLAGKGEHMDAIGFGQHNHAECIRQGLDSVDAQCKAAGLQFTPVRRRVLEMLLAEHRAHGAYEILDNHIMISVEDVLENEPGYFGWIQNADFPLYTKKVLTAIKLRSLNNKLS